METEKKTYSTSINPGIFFGSTLAIVISYAHNHSIFWALVHGVLGWIYIIYFCLIS